MQKVSNLQTAYKKRRNSALLFGSLLGLGIFFFPFATSASAETLEVHVHKNSPEGDEWTSSTAPIKVEIKDASGTGVGIGSTTGGLDPLKGGLILKTDQVCSFSWTDAAGNAVQKTVHVPQYGQLPAGNFLLPSPRLTDAHLFLEGQTFTHCGGNESAYTAFTAEIDALPANPFLIYREYLTLPIASGMLGQKITVSIADTSGNTIAAGTSTAITSYICQVAAIGETPAKAGICQQELTLNPQLAKDGVFSSNLVILENPLGAAEASPTVEPLVQGTNAEFSGPVTFVGDFLIRTTSLLDWSLAISDSGLRNEKITEIYQKSLNIVNGLFILALLTIAFLWNFSVIISRERLKRMCILFVIGIVGVNFTLPVTRLIVDGTNLLERTLLVKDSPAAPTGTTVTGGSTAPAVTNTITSRISASDILSSGDLDLGGFVGLQKASYVEKNYPNGVGTTVNTAKLTGKSDLYVDRFSEATTFTLILIFLGALGQLLIALILLFRHVIIWFLLILSPFLLILSLFPSTRTMLRSWLWLYARWLLIGPILAMTLFIVVNIWSLGGVPIESTYSAPSSLLFPNTTNLYVAAPGITSGYLSTPREIMKYIAALMMLYMTVFLPFWLTRFLPEGGALLNSKLFGKKQAAAERGNSSESVERNNSTSNKDKEMSALSLEVHDAPAEVTASGNSAKAVNPLSNDLSASEKLAGGNGKAALEKMPTRDLVTSLHILSTYGNESKTAFAAPRTQTEKEHIVEELKRRADNGDTLAQTVLNKEDQKEARSAEIKLGATKVENNFATPEEKTLSATPEKPVTTSPQPRIEKDSVGNPSAQNLAPSSSTLENIVPENKVKGDFSSPVTKEQSEKTSVSPPVSDTGAGSFLLPNFIDSKEEPDSPKNPEPKEADPTES